ncbi:MAG: beta-propeller fold lactonase family protein, partial [Candidatus Hydrogenedentes bacterium]|nr:beta-propeller fold lactonase family protein [Candidatus Hydrogenedentota bacterium]
LLPNQWYLDPVGDDRPLGQFPMNMRLSPDGQYLVVAHCGAGEHELMVFRTSGNQLVSRVVLPNVYYGLAFSPDGSRLYVSGGEDEVIHTFDFEKGYLSNPGSFPIAPVKEQHVPCGMQVSPDGAWLAVTETWGNAVGVWNAETGVQRWRRDFGTESRPYDCVFSPDGVRLFVSLWGQAKVAMIPLEGEGIGEPVLVETGEHPNELLLSVDGTRLFVANANVNTVSVIDSATMQVTETLNTALYPDALEGSTPNALAVSPDGARLFIANADNNSIAVFDIEESGKSRALGAIPVGWYPTSVRVSADGKTLYVANGKGFSSNANPRGPNPYMRDDTRRTYEQHAKVMTPGALSIIPMPPNDVLPELTARVRRCSPYREDKQPVAEPTAGNPIPAQVGDPSPIKHCIYIIKENRTYDQVFGDMPEGRGDPDLCLFPEKFTPNHHALAREYVLLDNFYVESQVSADGHEWTTGAYATDFVQKTWPSSYGGHGLTYPSEGRWPIAYPESGYIWDKCREAGVSYFGFGEFVGNPEPRTPEAGQEQTGTIATGDPDAHLEPATTPVKTLEGHFDPFYNGWDLDYLDMDRAMRFISEFNRMLGEGSLPQFMIVRLPNDHTAGTKEGSLSPRSMVADNDLALGMIVEAVSASAAWPKTAIFVVQDDAQNGPDHIDAHRTVAMVVSPYTRGRGLDRTMYSTASMLRSMELILGLQPMSQYDAGALPMYNTFRHEPDLTPYQCRPVPEELRTVRNSADAWGADLSAQLNFEKEDAADDLVFNEIVWRSIKGADSPMPAPVRAAFVFPVDDD